MAIFSRPVQARPVQSEGPVKARAVTVQTAAKAFSSGFSNGFS